jgi:hypothetical protein
MLTPVDATSAGFEASKPASVNRLHQLSPALKLTGTSFRNGATPKPSSLRRWRFQA